MSLHGGSGHTQVVAGVNRPFTSPVEIIASTIPRAVRSLSAHPFFNMTSPEVSQSGILKPLWVKSRDGRYYLENARQMPGYSLEQYENDFLGEHKDFSLAVFTRLSPNFSFERLMQDGVKAIQMSLEERKEIVENGFNFCSQNNCSEGTPGYEDWSTYVCPPPALTCLGVFKSLGTFIFPSELSPQHFTPSSSSTQAWS